MWWAGGTTTRFRPLYAPNAGVYHVQIILTSAKRVAAGAHAHNVAGTRERGSKCRVASLEKACGVQPPPQHALVLATRACLPAASDAVTGVDASPLLNERS